MKTILDGIDSSLNTTKEKINNYEDTATEIKQEETTKKTTEKFKTCASNTTTG